jgi:hypothetical protein
MKAMVRHKYGSPDVLQLEKLHKSTAGDDADRPMSKIGR